MLESLALLLALQTIGEVLSYALNLPIPGPVIGMVMLLALLALRPALVTRLKPTTTTLLQHLSLLFVPAGVGVMVHWQREQGEQHHHADHRAGDRQVQRIAEYLADRLQCQEQGERLEHRGVRPARPLSGPRPSVAWLSPPIPIATTRSSAPGHRHRATPARRCG